MAESVLFRCLFSKERFRCPTPLRVPLYFIRCIPSESDKGELRSFWPSRRLNKFTSPSLCQSTSSPTSSSFVATVRMSFDMYHQSTFGLASPPQRRHQQDFSVNSSSDRAYNTQIASRDALKTSDYASIVPPTTRTGSVRRDGKGSTYGSRKVMISSRSVSSFVSGTRSTREGTRLEASSIMEEYSRGGGHRQAAKDRRPQGQLRLPSRSTAF